MLPSAIISIWDAKFATVYARDVAPLIGSVTYGYDPNGCAAGALQTNLTWEEVFTLGYFQGRNGVEISTLDDVLTQPCAEGATRLYVTATEPYDTTVTLELPQIAVYDGFYQTVMIPVTGVGKDPTYGPYITIAAPLPAPGNPIAIPAYGAGAGIFRRRWAGRIGRRTRYHSGDNKKASIALVGIGGRLGECLLSGFAGNNIDAGAAVYAAIANNASRFTDLNLADMTQATVGSTYTGTNTNAFVSDVITQIIASIPADVWAMRIGADRVPRMLKYYTSATNTYTYTVSLSNHATRFVPMEVQSDDEDTSNMANAVLVTGDTEGNAGGTQVQAAAGDANSVATYGQIDAPVQTVTGAKDQATAEQIAEGLLNQMSYPQASTAFKVFVRNDTYADLAAAASPIGLANGDVCSGFEAITLAGFDETNAVRNAAIDSGIVFASGPDALWQTYGPSIKAVPNSFGQDENEWQIIAKDGGSADGPRIPVAPGQEWIFGAWIDTTGTTFDCGAAWNVLASNGTLLATIRARAHTPATLYTSQPFTIPAGIYMIYLQPMIATAHAGDSGLLSFFKPQLNVGNVLWPYVSNHAAPNIYGLPSSVTCTIDAGSDRVQTITFQPIEPDINASILERANAVANALLANRKAGVGFDRFIVSPEAEDYAYSSSSLTLAMPAFNAIFAKGTPVVTVNAQNLTLQPNCTTFLWVNPDGTYLQHQNDQSTVVGSILVAYFTTDGVGIVGDFLRASFGVLLAGVGNVDPATLPVPAWSSLSVETGASVNGIAADIDVALTLTNLPADATQLEYYYRVTAKPNDPANAWVPVGGENLTNPAVGFSYGAMLGGATYDLAIGYANERGYGPLATIASAFTAQTLIVFTSGSSTAPAFASSPAPTAANEPSANGITASVLVTFSVTNQPTDGSLSRVNVWLRESSQNNDSQPGSNQIGNAACNWAPAGVGIPAVGVGTSPAPASGAYSVLISDVVGGQDVDIGLTFEDTQGGESLIGAIIENFAATTVVIDPGQTNFENILNSNFHGLEIDARGILVMPTSQDIYPGQVIQDSVAVIGTPSPCTFTMKFQVTDSGVAPSLVLFSDASTSGTSYQNGYRLDWSGSTLEIWRRVSGTDIKLMSASAAVPAPPGQFAPGIPAVPPIDGDWHELKFVADAGFSMQNAPGPGILLTAYLDGIYYGSVYEAGTAGFIQSPNRTGGGNTHAAFLTSGICGPGNLLGSHPTFIDPKDFVILTTAGSYGEGTAVLTEAQQWANGADSPFAHGSHTRATDYPGGKNHIYNPTGTRGLNGWAFGSDNGSPNNWTTDDVNGGRFVANYGFSPGVYTAYRNQTITPQLSAGAQMTWSGMLACQGAATNRAFVQIFDASNNQLLGGTGTVYGGQGPTLMKATITVPASGTIFVRMRGDTNGVSTTMAAFFYDTQLEYGPIATTYGDDYSVGLVTQTHDTFATVIGVGASRNFTGTTAAQSFNNNNYNVNVGSVSFTPPPYGVWQVTITWNVPSGGGSNNQSDISISGAFSIAGGNGYGFLPGTLVLIGAMIGGANASAIFYNTPSESDGGIGPGTYTLQMTRMS